MGQNISNLVHIPKYGHMVFVQTPGSMKIQIQVQGTTSYTSSTLNRGLCIFRWFRIIGPKKDQIWARLPCTIGELLVEYYI